MLCYDNILTQIWHQANREAHSDAPMPQRCDHVGLAMGSPGSLCGPLEQPMIQKQERERDVLSAHFDYATAHILLKILNTT